MTAVLMPKRNGSTPEALAEWADRIIAFFEQQVVLETVDTAEVGDVPVGAVLDYAYTGGTPPSGFFLANGAVQLRSTYPNLFAVIGTAFNTGGELITQFRLPNQTTTINGVVCKRIIRHD